MRLRMGVYRVGKFIYGLNLRHQERPALSPQRATELMERYRPDIEKLEALLGRDLSRWYASNPALIRS